MRDIICQKETNVKTQLSQNERVILTVVSCLFSGYNNNDLEMKGHTSITQHAFGIGKSVHREVMAFLLIQIIPRKENCARTKVIPYSIAKRKKWTLTAFKTFKKRRTKDFREYTESFRQQCSNKNIICYQILRKRLMKFWYTVTWRDLSTYGMSWKQC